MKVLVNNKIEEVYKQYDNNFINCYYKNTNNIYTYDLVIILEPEEKYNISLLNKNMGQPNILHFLGTSKQRFIDGNIFDNLIFNMDPIINKPSNLSFITIYTDKDKCYLCKQSKRFGFDLINAAEDFVFDIWNMTYKIELLISAIEKILTDYVLITDGYDVLVLNLDNIIPKFLKFNTKILFNASKNNFPEVYIDKIFARDKRAPFMFFNAGCCIGYTKDVLNFYKECLDMKNTIKNPFMSELYIVRHVFAKYSETLTNNYEPSYVDFDYKSIIFLTLGNTMLLKYDIDQYEKLNAYNIL